MKTMTTAMTVLNTINELGGCASSERLETLLGDVSAALTELSINGLVEYETSLELYVVA